MENLDIDYTLDDTNDLFDNYFDNINLNKELEKFYELIADDELNENFVKDSNLVDIRNENYRRYNEIDLSRIEGLPDDFSDIVKEIKKIYEFIPSKRLLDSSMDDTVQHKKILDLLYTHLDQLSDMISTQLKTLEKQNDERQEKIKHLKFEKTDRRTLEKILSKYNYIVIYNAGLEDNVFDNFKMQVKRKEYLNELYKIINLEIDYSNQSISELEKLNNEITKEIRKIYEKLQYLEDLMFEKSKYKSEFITLKNYITNLVAYDDTNYSDTYRVYVSLLKDLKIESALNYLEDSLVEELESIQREKRFIYEKQGLRNLKISLDYISANYLDQLEDDEKEIINRSYKKMTNEEHDVEKMYIDLKTLVTKIWKNSITLIEDYDSSKEFNFICTNDQFIDEKHPSILITSKMLERVMDYSNYQIGFICDFNDNILYITENDDIMSVNYQDMSNLKTPKQLEQEFLNFKICNKIALNGYITRFKAVYFIDDGDNKKHVKAEELSKQHKLPLLILKKDKN